MNDEVNSTLERAEAVRRRTISLLDALMSKAKEFQLSSPPDALTAMRAKLASGTYLVTVIGEAKRGKSTFINAVIGKDILPTDVQIATSQVFRVSYAERESYRLRFENGSSKDITAADLPKYGSQVVVDDEVRKGRVVPNDKIIRWIEVELPMRFFPREVAVLDTPGLGSLYAAHGQITHRFIPDSDAVIFLFDTERPAGSDDLSTLEAVLKAIGDVFFVLNKIDAVGTEQWQILKERDEEILREKFGARLTDPRVWPMSSSNLRKAATAPTGAEALLHVSRHKELSVALRQFLYRVAGWSRATVAVVAAGNYHKLAREELVQRIKFLESLEQSDPKAIEIQRNVDRQRVQFNSDWGDRGEKRRELLDGVKRATTLARQGFTQAISPSGQIVRSFEEQIPNLRTAKEMQQFAEALPNAFEHAVAERWREAMERAHERCMNLLSPFMNAASSIILPSEGELPELYLPSESRQVVKDTWWRRVRDRYRNAMIPVSMFGILGAPIGIFVGIGVMLRSLFPGISEV
jgi:GTPase SAR1 family protein